MNREEIRQLIKEELEALIKSDRYTFHKSIQMLDKVNIQTSPTTGTKIGTATSQKIGFFNATPVDQPATVSDYSRTNVNDVGNTTNNTAINNNFSDLQTTVNAIIDRLQELGLIA